ncbi:MAG: glycosyltransferase [Thermoplasmata archaeon]|nr:glycosyltransferase [Thermoplasmata archaeon]MCI4354725.1 glycosyltransferase [Thermoplasmata archaeon]
MPASDVGARDAGPTPDPPSVLLLTNYRGGGIGDFGASLQRHLDDAVGPGLEVIETSRDGIGALGQAWRLATSRRRLVANVGLTGWGASGVKNLVGFAAIGAHRLRGRRTIVLVHHAIEMFGPEETGYPVTGAVRAGAHWALRRVRSCDLVVFSPVVEGLMRNRYGARSVVLTPLPCERLDRLPGPVGPGRVVTAGYLAPYKGLDLFLGAAERASERGAYVLAGRPHPVLSQRPAFRQQLDGWTERARSLGVAMPGYLSPDDLSDTLAGRSVGVLPYTSASGASASFSLFAERGVPVVATDLPEFRFLARSGAGITLVPPSVEAIAAAVERLRGDPELWEVQAGRQRTFARENDWAGFVGRIRGLLGAA